jgi:hypothetical protein
MYTYIMSHRTQITLTDNQYLRLKEEMARSGATLAELVRRAVDTVYANGGTSDPQEGLRASFGSWQGRELDGAAYVDELRPGTAKRLAR